MSRYTNGSYHDNPKLQQITQDLVQKLLSYDPISGLLTWNLVRGSTIRPGDKAQDVQMSLCGMRIQTSHVIWFHQTGEWPKGVIGFRNGNGKDYRWDNLIALESAAAAVIMRQEVTHPGIKQHSNGQWSVSIEIAGETLTLGIYRNYQVAAAVWDAAVSIRNHITKDT